MTIERWIEPATPWKVAATHEGTGRIAFSRTVDFEHTGNNEGVMTVEVSVKDKNGIEILKTAMTVEWEYHGYVRVNFSLDGTSISLSGSNGNVRTYKVPEF